MSKVDILNKLKVISVSDLQKNPSKGLDADIVLITKNGNKMGFYLSKEEFEDLLEETLPLKKDFVEELDNAVYTNDSTKNITLGEFLDD